MSAGPDESTAAPEPTEPTEPTEPREAPEAELDPDAAEALTELATMADLPTAHPQRAQRG